MQRATALAPGELQGILLRESRRIFISQKDQGHLRGTHRGSCPELVEAHQLRINSKGPQQVCDHYVA